VIPVVPPEDAKAVSADFEYEPDPKDVLDALLPHMSRRRCNRAVLENGIRAGCTHDCDAQRVDNASEFIEDLTLTPTRCGRRRSRQS